MRYRTSKALIAVAIGSITVSGCGLQTSSGGAPSGTLVGALSQYNGKLDGVNMAVGSKNFTEQLLLGKMAVILLQSAGAKVEDKTNIPGSSSARQAMLVNQINAMWEYTGTGWIAYLGHTNPIADPQKQYEAVRKEDLAKNHLVWLKPAPMNNTYGFAATKKTAKKLGISKLSQLKSVPAAQRTFCVEAEFASRNDGFQPMLKKYGVPAVPKGQIKTLDTGAIYAATADGVCNFGEVFTTDGRIKALDLTVLEDDKKFFPNYNVAMVLNEKVLNAHPDLRGLFAPLSAKLTSDTLIDLNAKIDVEGLEPSAVAWDWMVKEGFVSKSKPQA